MASRALNRIRDFNCSPSHSRRGQEHDHDQHSEQTARDRQRTDHVECRSKEESSGKQKESKTKARTASPVMARSRSPLEETLNAEAEVRLGPEGMIDHLQLHPSVKPGKRHLGLRELQPGWKSSLTCNK